MWSIGRAPIGRGLAAAMIVAVNACGPADAPAVGDRGGNELQGAVLILLDTVRPDHLSAYGHGRPTSPAIDRLAADGALFEQVVSAAPWTLPSVAAMLSGEPPGSAFRENRLQVSLVSSIRDAGYATAAFTEGGYVSRQFGFDLGFDEYVEEQGAVQLLDPGQRYDDRPAGGIEQTFRLAREWIEAHRGERFFVLIHTYEPHTPYTRPELTAGLEPGQVGGRFEIERLAALKSGALQLDESDLEYLAALYDGGILVSDRHVGELVEFLESLGLRERTLLAVTSDHGEELGDHYPRQCADHGHSLLDDQVLVPLILADPTIRVDVSRVRSQVRTIDIMPTLCDRLGVPAPTVAGASLMPILDGRQTMGRPAFGGSTKTGPKRTFMRHLGYKYIETAARQPPIRSPLTPPPPRIQLYDLHADPGETRNIAAERPELVERFRRRMADRRAGVTRGFEAPETPPNEALLERLRSLGYVQ